MNQITDILVSQIRKFTVELEYPKNLFTAEK